MNNTAKGKILKGVGGLYTVKILDDTSSFNGDILPCRARGSFRHDGITPLPGDSVTVLFENGKEDNGGFVIDSIDTRKNSLIRPPVANLDYIFVTMAASKPVPVLSTVDKLISIAEFNGIEPVIVITKSDIDGDFAKEIGEIYEKAGFHTFITSSENKEGIDAVKNFIDENLDGKTAAFAGASGIGKSTIMNALFPHLLLSTSVISQKIERGRHTTRKVELFPISESNNSGYIADTPGFSMLDFQRFDFFEKEDLPATMREFIPYIGKCKYTKCSHVKEEGCAIIEAMKKGEISKSRHDSFVEMYTDLKAKKKW